MFCNKDFFIFSTGYLTLHANNIISYHNVSLICASTLGVLHCISPKYSLKTALTIPSFYSADVRKVCVFRQIKLSDGHHIKCFSDINRLPYNNFEKKKLILVWADLAWTYETCTSLINYYPNKDIR